MSAAGEPVKETWESRFIPDKILNRSVSSAAKEEKLHFMLFWLLSHNDVFTTFEWTIFSAPCWWG